MRKLDFTKLIAELEKVEVKVGVLEGSRNAETGEEIAQYAHLHEKGIGVPKRAFLSSTVEEQSESWSAEIDALYSKLLEQKISIEQLAVAIGKRAAKDIKEKIGSNMPPPNSAFTLEKKRKKGRGSKTLIDTGSLKDSINYKVLYV